MKVEIITVGDELLIGQVVDTNSAWMGQQLNQSGFSVSRITTVSDNSDEIIHALDESSAEAGIILITGGLGPTRDDLTRDTLCRYFDSGLVTDQEVLDYLSAFFKSRGRELTEINRRQADVPEKCRVIHNKLGTAPGMWFDANGKIYVSMPGVPFEMKAMMNEFVLPELRKRFKLPSVCHRHILTIGVGESFLAELLHDWELSLPAYMKLAYLPAVATVRLRLSCYDSSPEREKELDAEIEKARKIASKYVFSTGDYTPEEVIGKSLLDAGNTIAVAESCTGGYISHLITSVPGSSAYYIGSSVSYANSVKTRFLGVDAGIIESKGAVSEEVAVAMAKGVREKLGSTWALATTGVAGPGGGTDEKPVGTVWIGVAGPDVLYAKMFKGWSDRQRNIRFFSMMAFNLLKNELDRALKR